MKQNPQTLAYYEAQTLSMVGCNGADCLTGKPANLCGKCINKMILLLGYAACPAHHLPR